MIDSSICAVPSILIANSQVEASSRRSDSPVSTTRPVKPSPTRVRKTSATRALRSRQLALEGDRLQLVAVADEDSAVVVIDQLAELVGDRHADLAHVGRAVELAGERLEHLQVRDRADVLTAVVGFAAARSPSRRRRRPGSCRAPSRSSSRPRRRRRARAGSPRARGPWAIPIETEILPARSRATASSRVTSRVASATACASWLAGEDHGELLAADPADDIAGPARWRADGRRARPAPRRRPRGRRRRSPS